MPHNAMPPLRSNAALQRGAPRDAPAAHGPALRFAAQPTLLSGDGAMAPYHFDLKTNPSDVPRATMPPQRRVGGNVNPWVRSLQRGDGGALHMLPAKAPKTSVTRQLAMEVLHTAQQAAPLRFSRGGPFVPADFDDASARMTRLHSVAGHALDRRNGPMLADVAVQLGVLPVGEPVAYPHPATGAPTLYLCSYLGSELTALWVRHAQALVHPVGDRAHDVHRMLAAEFRRMISQEHARREAAHRYNAQYAFRRDNPMLAEKYARGGSQYERNVRATASSLTHSTRDRIRRADYNLAPAQHMLHAVQPPRRTEFGIPPRNYAMEQRVRPEPGQRTLTGTQLPSARA